MMLPRFDLRRFGSLLALAGWLLLVSDLCVDLGPVHVPIGPISAHGAGDSDEGHATVHGECGSVLLSSTERNPLPAPTGLDLSGPMGSVVPSSLVVAPACVHVRSTDTIRSRSAPPLYVLYAIFQI